MSAISFVGPSIARLSVPRAEVRRRLIALIDRAGLTALNHARRPANTPKLTGALIRSTSWTEARETSPGTFRGAIGVGVIYGRRQEFEHPTLSMYLLRAAEVGSARLVRELGNDAALSKLGIKRRTS